MGAHTMKNILNTALNILNTALEEANQGVNEELNEVLSNMNKQDSEPNYEHVIIAFGGAKPTIYAVKGKAYQRFTFDLPTGETVIVTPKHVVIVNATEDKLCKYNLLGWQNKRKGFFEFLLGEEGHSNIVRKVLWVDMVDNHAEVAEVLNTVYRVGYVKNGRFYQELCAYTLYEDTKDLGAVNDGLPPLRSLIEATRKWWQFNLKKDKRKALH